MYNINSNIDNENKSQLQYNQGKLKNEKFFNINYNFYFSINIKC